MQTNYLHDINRQLTMLQKVLTVRKILFLLLLLLHDIIIIIVIIIGILWVIYQLYLGNSLIHTIHKIIKNHVDKPLIKITITKSNQISNILLILNQNLENNSTATSVLIFEVETIMIISELNLYVKIDNIGHQIRFVIFSEKLIQFLFTDLNE